jgi:hypothetical protein
MCLRLVFLLITRIAAWLPLSRREDAWKTAKILLPRHQLAVLRRRQPRPPEAELADRALIATLLSVIPTGGATGCGRACASKSQRRSCGRSSRPAASTRPGWQAGPTWSQFLRSQPGAILASGFSRSACSTVPRLTS